MCRFLVLLVVVLAFVVLRASVMAATEIIIDNPDAAFVGSWQTGTSSSDKYGSDYRFAGQNTTSGKSATYTPSIPTDGIWGIYTWYPQGSGRPINAQYIVHASTGDSTLYVNQQTNGGKWNLLGTYSFTAGINGYVRITNYGTDTTKVVMADGIRFYSEAGGGDTDPPAIAPGVTASPGETTATITWTTNELSTSQVEYGLTSSYGNQTNLDVSLTLSHTVNLSGLSPQTLYHYRVRSMDAAGNLGVSDDLTLTTTASEPPVISQVSAVPASNSAAVSWITNEPTTSQVEYGLTVSYGSETPKVSAPVQGHSVTVPGLSPLATYHYRVKSEDAIGNLAVSEDYTFATTAPISGEFRGIWVDTWHQGILSAAQVTTLVNTVGGANYNAIIPEVRKCGDAYYNSPYEPRATNIVGSTFDPLADLITKAHAAGVEVHPWIVTYRIWNSSWGAAPANHIWALHPDWALISSSGANSESGYYNLDPGVPGAQDYICKVVMDIVGRYDIDGFEFDYIRYPGANWGYNPITKQRFLDEYGFWPPTSSSDPNWGDWCDYRRQQVTDLVKKCYLNIMAVKPHINVAVDSVAWMGADPHTDYESTQQYSEVFQDVRTWMLEHIVDTNRLMNYKREHDTAQAMDYDLWTDWLAIQQEDTGRMGVEGQANYLNSVTNSIHQMQVAREAGLGITNYSYAVTNKDGEPAANFFSAIETNLFTTQVPTPDMPWKSAPTTGIIFGTVTDASHPTDPVYSDWIYKAAVSVSGPVTQNTVTDATGTYGFLDLPPGTYSITVTKSGFAPQTISGVVLTTGQVDRRDVELGLPVTVTSPAGVVVNGWSLLSLPVQPADPDPAVVFNGIDIDGRLYRWDNPTQSLFIYDSWGPEQFGEMNLENGCWLDSSSAVTISYQGISSSATTHDISLPTAGWAIIGCPFPVEKQWPSTTVKHDANTASILDASHTNGWLNSSGYWWDASTQSLVDFGLPEDFASWETLQPWHGYWVQTYVAGITLTLR